MSDPAPPPALVGELRFHRLLVAVDGSLNGDLALSAAVTAARRDGAAVTLLTVARDVVADAARWPGAMAYPGPTQDEVDGEAARLLRSAADRVPDDVLVHTVVRRGRAGPEIVAEARAGTYDAILLGARGVGRIGALLGSVSQHVLHHADVAVLVAHAPRPDDGAG
jgi:nucleotide-binding universal stress UspA family protein